MLEAVLIVYGAVASVYAVEVTAETPHPWRVETP